MKNIVFAGGGFKGWAYIGTIKALHEYINFSQIEQIIGVSIGSFFGLMYLLNFDSDFLLDFSMNLDFKELCDIDIDNIIENQSIFVGTKFTDLIKQIISYKLDPNVTFSELKKYSNKKFTVNALNISDSKLEYFNYDLTPDIKVVDAIRASCGLPFLFPAYQINGKFYLDGGICNNCPIDLVDEIDTIAFDVSRDESSNNSSFKLFDFLNSLISISNKYHYNGNAENIYRILDSRFNDERYNLNQSKDDIFNIYMNGYINSKNIIFKNHIALPDIPEKNILFLKKATE
jgi:predicted acylesterase/phospholipase RssA